MVFMVARVFRFVLNLCPLFRIFFSDDGGFRVCVVFGEVVFELDGDDLVGILRDHFEEFGVSHVSERIAARFNDELRYRDRDWGGSIRCDRSVQGRSAGL